MRKICESYRKGHCEKKWDCEDYHPRLADRCLHCGNFPANPQTEYFPPTDLSKIAFSVSSEEEQKNLLLAWNIIEKLHATYSIDTDLKECTPRDAGYIRNNITHLPEDGCLAICDAIDFLAGESNVVKLFNELIQWDEKTLKGKLSVDDSHVPYLFFIQVLAVCREVLSFRLKSNQGPTEENQVMEKSQIRAPKEDHSVGQNPKVVITHKRVVSHEDHPWTIKLNSNGLKTQELTVKLHSVLGLDFQKLQARNQFRNCACCEILCTATNPACSGNQCRLPLLDGHRYQLKKDFISFANNHSSIDYALKEELKATLRKCKDVGSQQKKSNYTGRLLGDSDIDEIVITIERLTNIPLVNLCDLLYTLNSQLLKQREKTTCKDKANNMKRILNAVPALLKFPDLLGLTATDFKDFSLIYDKLMAWLDEDVNSTDNNTNERK